MTVSTTHLHAEYIITAVDGARQTVVDNAVNYTLTVMYAVQEITGGGADGGVTTCIPGASADIYDDGVDVLALDVTAAGRVRLQRTAGADTFNVRLMLMYI